MVAGEDNVLQGQPLHPLKHALQIFTAHQKKGWALTSGKHCKGNLVPRRKQVAHKSGTKAVFLVLKEFQDLCSNNVILIATDNTTVVAYVNKEGDEVGPSVCPSAESPDLVLQKTGHS